MPSFTLELSELELQLQCIYDSIGHWSGEEGSLTNILMTVQKRMKRLAEIAGKRILELDWNQRSNRNVQTLEAICRDALATRTAGYDADHDLGILNDMRSQLEHIRSTKNIFSKKDRKKIVDIVQGTNERLVALIGSTLHLISFFQPEVTTLERMIRTFPKSLFTPHRETNLLPIQTAALYGEGAKYIPVLAKVGQIHNVGGENQRGGLLTNYPDNWEIEPGIRNTLQFLTFYAGDEEEDVNEEDMRYLNALKALKEETLLLKDDVFFYDLLCSSGWTQSKHRFKFILQLDPSAAFKKCQRYFPFMHRAMRRGAATIRAISESTFECYPGQTGLLFQKDLRGMTAFDIGLDMYGENTIMSVIRDVISSITFPILHHVLFAAPKYTSMFAKWFPEAYFLRDSNERSLIQAILAAGGKCVKENSIIFASISYEQIQERDPVTMLYPFAAVASGKDGDLQKSFYLLRRQPGVLNGMIPKNNTSKKRGKKRKKGKAD